MASDANLPPHPLDKKWYVHVEGQTYGPYSGHDIKKMADNSQIHESDFVCPDGGSAWIAAKADPILGSIFRKSQTTTEFHAPPPINANGGTVVQVTNQIPNNNAAAAALLMASGDAAPKSPGVALLISFFICGGGQMYNGQVGKGFLMLIGFALTIWMFGLGLIIWIWSLVDAYSTAKQMNLKYQQRVLAGLM
jgi:TM2 domain-containing membrane protein YozV